MTNSPTLTVTLAAVSGAHGVTGEVRLKLFTDTVDSLRLHKSFNDGALTIKSLRSTKDGAIARFAEINDRNASEKLRGTVLTVPVLGQRGWNAVRLAVTGRAFTLLPAPLFRAGDEAAALRLHHTATATETVRHTTHPGLELVNVFAADAALADWLAATHGAAGRLLHHTSAFLAGLVHQRGAASPRRLYLSPGPQELTLVVMGPHLEYCNVFACTTAEDVVYYTILVMQELGLDPDADEVTVWGELTPDSAVFSLLRTYVRNVRFGPRPADVQYSYRLNDVFEYRYFDLLSLHFAQ